MESATKTTFLQLWNYYRWQTCPDSNDKPMTSACYDKQHVCTYLQPFSH